ncbi:MAG: hypothetical protein RQ745_14165 [Longimicrobiales bacterium]|nr:hypothetical protein [Longimicrobiales bacterium]
MKRVIWTIGMVLVAIAALVPGGEVRAVQDHNGCDVLFQCQTDYECENAFGPHCSQCDTQTPVLPGGCGTVVYTGER